MTGSVPIKLDNFCKFYTEIVSGSLLDAHHPSLAENFMPDSADGNAKLRDLRSALVSRMPAHDIEGTDSRDMAIKHLEDVRQGFREGLSAAYHNNPELQETQRLQAWVNEIAKQHAIPLKQLIEPASLMDKRAVYLDMPDPNTLSEKLKATSRDLGEQAGVGNIYTRAIAVTQRAFELDGGDRPDIHVYKTQGTHGRKAFKIP